MKGDYLKKPITAKKMETTYNNEFVLHSCEMQGWRRTMQDSKIFMELGDRIYLFGVFDGHGGPQVAHYVAKMLPKQLLNEPYFKLKNYQRALVNVFKRIDELLVSERGQAHLQEINKQLGYRSTFSEDKISFRAGCTANVVLITPNKYYVANVGDSRSVLSRGDKAVTLSKDHKPDFPEQRERIEKAGGYVVNGRVNGCLNLSRAFGDFEYKFFSKKLYHQQPIISVPEVVQVQRTKLDNFILIGCDGVWERYVNNNQKMVDRIQQLSERHKDKRAALEKLIQGMTAKDLKDANGWDNMTALLIQIL